MSDFKNIGLDENILLAIEKMGFKTPSEVQSKTIPILLNDETDLVALAQTGTGKTAAFALPNPGAISKPVKTNFGWHILKLMEKKSNPTFQNAKMDFENKVKKDTRSKLIKDKMYTRLLGKYKVNYLTSNLVYFKNKMSVTDYFSGKWEKPKDFPKDSLFMEIEQKRISYDDFANFLIRTQRDYNPKWDIDAL